MDTRSRFARRLSLLFLASTLTLPATGQAAPDDEPVYVAPPAEPNAHSAPSAPPPKEYLELELVLLVDSSSSVDDDEYQLQRNGYAAAFRDPEVQAAILGCDGVLVRYVEWSSRQQYTTNGWTELRTERDCNRYANVIEARERRHRHGTNMASALANTLWAMNRNQWVSERQVIDVSGDGVCENEHHYRNGGEYIHELNRPWPEVLVAREPTTTINAISIGGDPDLVEWYENTVPQGADSFAMNVTTFEEFSDAIKRKLIREIVDPRKSAPLIGYD